MIHRALVILIAAAAIASPIAATAENAR